MNQTFDRSDRHVRDHSGDRLRANDGRAAFVAQAIDRRAVRRATEIFNKPRPCGTMPKRHSIARSGAHCIRPAAPSTKPSPARRADERFAAQHLSRRAGGACTRARHCLLVIRVGPASEFLDELAAKSGVEVPMTREHPNPPVHQIFRLSEIWRERGLIRGGSRVDGIRVRDSQTNPRTPERRASGTILTELPR
jgi:hypothetical protein